MDLSFYKYKNLFLSGCPGLSMRKDALSLAKQMLNYDRNLFTHPDFLLIERSEKKTLGIEDSNSVISRAAIRPALAEKHIIVIDGINFMTVQAQNKLLKLLEDADNVVVIAISYEEKDVLDTIISRLSIVRYEPLTYDAFCAELPAGKTDSVLLFNMTGGCPGLCDEMLPFVPMFKSVQEAIHSGKRENLLPSLHLLKEKDINAITASNYIPQMIHFIQACFYSELDKVFTGCSPYSASQISTIIMQLQKSLNICRFPSYTKDNFFQSIIDVIET